MPEWIPVSETTLWWMGVVSVLTFVGSLVVLPFVVARIPADYFVRDRQCHSGKPRTAYGPAPYRSGGEKCAWPDLCPGWRGDAGVAWPGDSYHTHWPVADEFPRQACPGKALCAATDGPASDQLDAPQGWPATPHSPASRCGGGGYPGITWRVVRRHCRHKRRHCQRTLGAGSVSVSCSC